MADEAVFCQHCGARNPAAPQSEQAASEQAPPSGAQQYYQPQVAPASVMIYPRQHSLPLVIVLNLIFPGIGNLIFGQTAKGLVMFAATVVLGTGTCGVLWFVSCVVMTIDGVMLSNKLNSGQPIGQWEFFG